MAQQMAMNIPDSEKKNLQGMRMEDMMQHVSKNVMQFMNTGESPLIPSSGESQKFLSDIMQASDSLEKSSKRTPDLTYNVSMSLEDLYKGKTKKISFKRKIVTEKGKKTTEKKTLEIVIPPGTVNGKEFRLEGQADIHHGKETGDVVVIIEEIEHDVFERESHDLFITKDVSLSELFGYEGVIKHLDGRKILVKSKPGDCLHVGNGLRRVPGEGMPVVDSNSRGDLFIRFNLCLPDEIPSEHVETLKKIFPRETSNDLPPDYTFSEEAHLEKIESTDSESESCSDHSDLDNSDSDNSEVSENSEGSENSN